MGNDLVLIGPNGWPIVIAGVLFSILGYWLWRSTNPRPAGSSASTNDLSAPQGVNNSAPVMSPTLAQTTPDQQTDEADRRADTALSVADQWLDRIEVDRTRTAIIELMVYSGWATGEIRAILKGDNNVLGPEIEAAKKRLGIVDEPRQLRVRDEKGERMIPMDVVR